MKILQVNTWSGRLLKPLSELIQAEKPDFLCLQEVVSLDADIHSLLGTIEELKEETGYSEQYYSPVFRFRLMNREAYWGNCILSNHTLIEKNTIFTNQTYAEDFNFDEYDYNIRNLQHVVARVDGKKLNILNHHGHHIPSQKRGDAETMRQMKLIGEYIDSLSGPVILTGDFNLAPDSESLMQINNRLDNQSVKYKLKTTRTPLTHKTEVCDFIFTNDKVKVGGFKASDEIVSDHKALILEFEI
jgi:endonuclease/exonuclease/phosphatase family metal-dependent hydrolase